jgi:hypothetical protein
MVQNKTTAKAESRKSKSNWLSHEAQIEKGYALEIDGWVQASQEAMKWKSVSEYAKESAKLSTTHSQNTIRQYCGDIAKGIKHYGSADKMLAAFDQKYTVRNITDLRLFLRGLGQRDAGKAVRFSAKREAEKLGKRYTKAQLLEIAKYL